MGIAIVLVIRLVAPLAVLKSPFWGGLVALASDAIDVVIFQLTDFPDYGYQETDKLLDVWYMALFAFVAQGWESLPRVTANILFVYRMIGIGLFEITGNRTTLLVFPNLFELFFLFYAGVRAFSPSTQLALGSTLGCLAVLLIPKMGQEYLLHYSKTLDKYSAVEIIGDGWEWATGAVPGPSKGVR